MHNKVMSHYDFICYHPIKITQLLLWLQFRNYSYQITVNFIQQAIYFIDPACVAAIVMAFSFSSRNIRLDASFLKAECADYSGHYRESKINLNSYIANVDGQLKWAAGGNFFASSSNLRCVGASTLEATCRKINGQQIISRIDLNDAITNRNGHLLGLLPNVPGYYSATSIDISLRGTVLRAKCKTNKGDYHESTIDLNDYIANLNGCLEWGGQAFGGSSRNISLDGSSFLVAECVDKSGHYYRTSINLDHHIFNANGKLEMYIHRFVIKVDKHNAERVANVLQSYYDANKGNVRTQVADGDGVKVIQQIQKYCMFICFPTI